VMVEAPRDLSPKEAAFLASIIPNPARYHVYYQRGGLTEAFEERVRVELEKMYAADLIDAQQLLEAVSQPLVFAPAGSPRDDGG
jgi:penicillin-binding protein 1A